MLGSVEELGVFKAHDNEQKAYHRWETIVALVPNIRPFVNSRFVPNHLLTQPPTSLLIAARPSAEWNWEEDGGEQSW